MIIHKTKGDNLNLSVFSLAENPTDSNPVHSGNKLLFRGKKNLALQPLAAKMIIWLHIAISQEFSESPIICRKHYQKFKFPYVEKVFTYGLYLQTVIFGKFSDYSYLPQIRSFLGKVVNNLSDLPQFNWLSGKVKDLQDYLPRRRPILGKVTGGTVIRGKTAWGRSPEAVSGRG